MNRDSDTRRTGMSSISPRLPVLCAMLMIAANPVHALDPTRQITQYGHTAWRVKSGYFSGPPNAITQSADGYIWIGTQAGLMRFDGVRFVHWTPPHDQPLPSRVVSSLLAARDGGLWIGTEAGLARWADGRLTAFTAGRGTVIAIVEDRDGTVWFTRSRLLDPGGPLCQVAATTVRCFGPSEGILDRSIGALVLDRTGDLWVGGASALYRGRPGRFSEYKPSSLAANADMAGVTGIALAPDEGAWVGIGRPGEGAGLQRLGHGAWKPVITPALDGRSLEIASVFRDRDGGIWVGSLSEGVYRVHDNTAHRFRAADGLSGDNVFQFYEDREGSIWVVTSGGIDHFRDLRVATYSRREGLSSGEVDGVVAARDGSVLIASAGALDILRQDRVSSMQVGKGLPGNQVTSLLEDRGGRLWVGIDTSLHLYENARFSRIDLPDGRPIGLVVGMAEDDDDNLWVEVTGTPRKLLRIRDKTVHEVFPEPAMPPARRVAGAPGGGIWLGLMSGDLARFHNGALEVVPFKPDPPPMASSIFNQLLVEPDGTVLGATAFGLIGWRHGTRRTLTVRNGLPCDHLFGLVTDDEGDLWLYTQCGVVELSSATLHEWWTNPDVLVRALVLDALDGAQGGSTPFAAAARSADRRLWFANGSVLQMIDPARLRTNELPPPVAIEEIVADRTSYAAVDALRLPPLTRDLQISYTALSFVVPQKVRFKYKLEGHDGNWIDPGTRRQAFYGDLPPGDYRFRVMASNNDGVWNEAGAALRFSVAPAWYETRAFHFAIALAAVGVIWGVYKLRVRHIAATLGAQFDGRMRERLRLARDLHDTLLQTITASKLVVDAELTELDDPEQRQAAQRVSTWLEQAMTEGRRALNSLRTSAVPQLLSLSDALRRAADDLVDVRSMAVTFSVAGEVKDVHPIVGEEIASIGREAIWNACRHSNGTQLEIELRYGAGLTLRIRDNGQGIEPGVAVEHGHFGIEGMRERAANIGGTLRVGARGASGTEVVLVVPGPVVFGRRRRAKAVWSRTYAWLAPRFAVRVPRRAASSSETREGTESG